MAPLIEQSVDLRTRLEAVRGGSESPFSDRSGVRMGILTFYGCPTIWIPSTHTYPGSRICKPSSCPFLFSLLAGMSSVQWSKNCPLADRCKPLSRTGALGLQSFGNILVPEAAGLGKRAAHRSTGARHRAVFRRNAWQLGNAPPEPLCRASLGTSLLLPLASSPAAPRRGRRVCIWLASRGAYTTSGRSGCQCGQPHIHVASSHRAATRCTRGRRPQGMGTPPHRPAGRKKTFQSRARQRK
eukprot:scaffold126494_cov30-Tisochrysis_lutea.AAC.3